MLRVLLAVALFAFVLFGLFLLFSNRTSNTTPELVEEGALQTSTSTQSVVEVLPYGVATIAMNQWVRFPDMRIKPKAVIEDSRCPLDVQCIQMGTVRIQLEVVSGLGTSTNTLALGDSLTTEAEEVTFVAVLPSPLSTQTIKDEDYSFTLAVAKRVLDDKVPIPQPPALPSGACYVGGCSSQLCSDTQDMVSTCEYKEEYACYQNARCERQSNGNCGWTPTSELAACLQETKQPAYPQ